MFNKLFDIEGKRYYVLWFCLHSEKAINNIPTISIIEAINPSSEIMQYRSITINIENIIVNISARF